VGDRSNAYSVVVRISIEKGVAKILLRWVL
jgi:hypothetical protein